MPLLIILYSFYLGLLVDTINANMLKAVFRRLRPPGSGMTDMVVIDGPAKFSFPSSCASRVVFTLGFCAFGMTHPIWINLLLASWVICVCLSQVLTRQSFVLDIIGGSVLGALEVYAILNFLSRQHLVA